MLTVTEAISNVQEQVSALPAETVRLEAAHGRFLSEAVVADSDLPPFDRAQMDGYALLSRDVQNCPSRLRIVGESAAGRGWHKLLEEKQAVRIMTGAPVPLGADAVQKVEVTRELDDGSLVEILEPVGPGRSIVRRGTEIRAGDVVLNPGDKINAPAMAVLASFGYARVTVGAKPTVAVLSTGAELVSVDHKPGPDQIRDSNNYSISAYAVQAGASIERLPLATDDLELLKQQILNTAESVDVVVASGGVSMGVYDFTKLAVKELGAKIFFDRVALRPGKPTVFAKLPNGKLFFGLPGNPVSVSVTFNLFVRTALLRLQGATQTTLSENWALLSREVKGANDRESYLPSRLSSTSGAELIAEPLKWGGSSDFVGFAHATALIKVPAGHNVQAGSPARILHLPG